MVKRNLKDNGTDALYWQTAAEETSPGESVSLVSLLAMTECDCLTRRSGVRGVTLYWHETSRLMGVGRTCTQDKRHN